MLKKKTVEENWTRTSVIQQEKKQKKTANQSKLILKEEAALLSTFFVNKAKVKKVDQSFLPNLLLLT